MTTFFWLVKEAGEVRAISFDGWEAGWAYVKGENGENTYYNVFLTDSGEVVIKEDNAEGTVFYTYDSEAEAADAGWRHILESERVRWGLNELRSWRERNERIQKEWLKQIEEYKNAHS
jgi:hypothetical protein